MQVIPGHSLSNQAGLQVRMTSRALFFTTPRFSLWMQAFPTFSLGSLAFASIFQNNLLDFQFTCRDRKMAPKYVDTLIPRQWERVVGGKR